MHQSTLQVKRVDRVFDANRHTWKYEDTAENADPQIPPGGKTLDGSDVWQSFCFVVVRQIPPPRSLPGIEPTVGIIIKSPHLRAVCKDVIGISSQGSWTIDPLEVRPLRDL